MNELKLFMITIMINKASYLGLLNADKKVEVEKITLLCVWVCVDTYTGEKHSKPTKMSTQNE